MRQLEKIEIIKNISLPPKHACHKYRFEELSVGDGFIVKCDGRTIDAARAAILAGLRRAKKQNIVPKEYRLETTQMKDVYGRYSQIGAKRIK